MWYVVYERSCASVSDLYPLGDAVTNGLLIFFHRYVAMHDASVRERQCGWTIPRRNTNPVYRNVSMQFFLAAAAVTPIAATFRSPTAHFSTRQGVVESAY